MIQGKLLQTKFNIKKKMYSNFLRHPSAPPDGAAARTLKTTELGESANVNLIMKT